MFYAIVGMLVIIFDQVVKYWVDKNINWQEPVKELIPNVISLVRVQNDGAAFSFLAGGGARIWFIVLTGIFTLVVILALVTNFISGKFGRWCLVMITAGGLSNCIDRILYGYVLDMFKVDLFNFAVLNVADIFITVFAILFILYILFGGEKELNDPDEFDEDEENPSPVKAAKRKPKKVKADSADYDTDYAAEKKVIKSEKSSFSKAKADNSSTESERRFTVAKNNYASGDNTAANDEFEAFFAKKSERSEAAPKKTSRPLVKDKSVEEEKKPGIMPVRLSDSAPVQEDVKPVSSDPFAEWDRANGKTTQSFTPSIDAVAEKAIPVNNYVEENIPTKPSAGSSGSDDFDLDAILNEFK